MGKVGSKDGTAIAFDRLGDGPPVILVDGALCYRDSGPMRPLATLLAPHFSVWTYDRRGRGESGNNPPYSTEREVEDLGALVQAAGGSACVYGVSSGAALALEAASRGLGITRLALYEAPFIVDNSRPPITQEWVAQLNKLVEENRRGDAVKHFMKVVGVPSLLIGLMRLMPVWSKLTAIAHTLPYDISIVNDNQKGKRLTSDRWASAVMPTLVMEGGKSPAWMRKAMKELSGALPNARHRTLEGQTHMVKPKPLSAVLVEFFQTQAVRRV
jgi:pimeloyl-ACP methyl ester carboxylesterase